jgi:DNA-binding transcriptional MerR regulator/methylmalonyl-CoA mutase cobalamin-binding subunit
MSVSYTIGTLSRLIGLSTHTIRAWERRYSALSPDRSVTNRRVYGDEDLQRLTLLKRIVESGHSIGQVAHLPNERLQSLDSDRRTTETSPQLDRSSRFLSTCKDAVTRLDPEALEQALVRGTATLGIIGLIDGVVLPLLADIEARWLEGSLHIAQEHLSTAVLRTYLDHVRISMTGSQGAPRLLLTTPRNQHHELGSLLVAIVAATESWNVTYLGPNLPAGEIAHSARVSASKAIGLSLVYPTDDPELAIELRKLREEVGPHQPILVGGRAAIHYARTLQEIHAQICPDLGALREALGSI